MQECKRCLLREMAEASALDGITERINELSPDEKADDELYSQRLNECKKCEHLISGVCMKCGCYVEFRAAFKKQNCPNAKDRKW